MSNPSRIQAIFAVLAALVVLALGAAYFTGAFGTVAWRSIDLVRLGGQTLFLLAGVIVFGRIAGGRNRRRPPPMAVYALGTVLQLPLILNTHNPVVTVAGAAVAVMMAAMAVASAILIRRSGVFSS